MNRVIHQNPASPEGFSTQANSTANAARSWCRQHAGAATLTASASAEAGKQAMREGVVDFLVTTLDEALRILKNEVRKHETVAVCVARRRKR